MNTKLKHSFVHLSVLGMLCVLSPKAFAAVDTAAGNASFQYLDIPPSPRQIAMGWTGTALGENGFAYYNPASPAIDKTSFLSVGYAPLPFDISIAHAQGSYMISDFFIGANITNHVISGIYPTDANHDPDYNTPFSDNGTLLALNAGFINDRLGIGLTLNGLQQQIGTATAYGLSASLGLVYALTNNIMLGAAGQHLGTTTGFTDDTKKFGQGYNLPRSARAGAAYTDTLLGVPFTASGDIVYRDVGLASTPVSQRFNRITVPIGIEVRPTSYVAVRLGKRFNEDSDLLAFGAGLHWSMLTFDLAFACKNYINSFEIQPFFSLTYALAPAVRDIPQVKAPVSESKTIIEKPAEKKLVPAAPQQPAPVPASVGTDTAAAAPSIVPEKAPVPQDSIAPVLEKTAAPAESKPVEPAGKNAQSDSVQTKQPVAPGKP
jgi:hypothetical protein